MCSNHRLACSCGRNKANIMFRNHILPPMVVSNLYCPECSENITPQVEVKSRRVGGATFQVPTEIRPDRKISISMKNLILFAKKRGGQSMSEKLAAEILAAYNEEGGAVKKKEDTHRMAEANKAFAHFRF